MTWTLRGLVPPDEMSDAEERPRGAGWRRRSCTDSGYPKCVGTAARGNCTCALSGWARDYVPPNERRPT